MTEDVDKNKNIEKELDNICEECKKTDESVTENLMLSGYKICKQRLQALGYAASFFQLF